MNPRTRTVAVIAALVALAALGGAWALAPGGAGAEGTPSTVPMQAPTKGVEGTRVERVDHLQLAVDLITGRPIVPGDFADPYVLSLPEANFAYATNTNEANIPVIRFPRDNQSIAQYLGDALPEVASWSTKGFQWAPSVLERPGGRFVMYYTTPAPDGAGRQCISRAVADDPAGPFVDDTEGPLVCPLELGGAIDPSPVLDEKGHPYLLWKSDGDCCSLPTTIFAQPLAADGLSFTGDPVALIGADQPWEANLVEAPSMVRRPDGRWQLFYSANAWNTDDYAVGIATCETVTGPCTKPLDKPWMSSAGFSDGPGGQEFFPSSGGVWMVHHGWLPGTAGTPKGERRLYLDAIEFDGPHDLPVRVGARNAWTAVGLIAGGVVLLVGLAWLVIRRLRRRRGSPAEAS